MINPDDLKQLKYGVSSYWALIMLYCFFNRIHIDQVEQLYFYISTIYLILYLIIKPYYFQFGFKLTKLIKHIIINDLKDIQFIIIISVLKLLSRYIKDYVSIEMYYIIGALFYILITILLSRLHFHYLKESKKKKNHHQIRPVINNINKLDFIKAYEDYKIIMDIIDNIENGHFKKEDKERFITLIKSNKDTIYDITGVDNNFTKMIIEKIITNIMKSSENIYSQNKIKDYSFILQKLNISNDITNQLKESIQNIKNKIPQESIQNIKNKILQESIQNIKNKIQQEIPEESINEIDEELDDEPNQDIDDEIEKNNKTFPSGFDGINQIGMLLN